MMSEEMKLLNYFDTIFGTNTINHIEIDMPLLKFIFYELSFCFGYLVAKELERESKIKKE